MTEPPLTIYTPDSLLSSPLRMAREMLRDLASSRELAWRLTVRDLSAQYRQTFLGFLWAILLPLANTLVWVFLSRSGVVNVSDTPLPYPVYVFTGTMLWAILMDALNAPLQIVTASKIMLARINFPREALVVAGIYQTIVNALIKVTLLLIALLVMGIPPVLERVVVSHRSAFADPGRNAYRPGACAIRFALCRCGQGRPFIDAISDVPHSSSFRDAQRRPSCHFVPAESANPADPYRA